MDYEMEELVPIVGKLAEKYTARESTSITYEKAEQLMGAVLYCIHEVEQFGYNSVTSTERIPAQQAYEMGLTFVEEKVKKALNLYNEILPQFVSYENHCLYDTFVKGIPEFFKWYCIHFEPQNTILTLDYPVLKDLSGYTGIDKIYEFLECIHLEQSFLNRFPKDYIIHVLSKYNGQYKDMIKNLCEIVFMDVIGHILARKSLSKVTLAEEDYLKIQKIFVHMNPSDIKKQLKNATKEFIQEYYGDCNTLFEYLTSSIDNIIVRLKNASDNGVLHRILKIHMD